MQTLQFSGIIAAVFYSNYIFENAGGNISFFANSDSYSMCDLYIYSGLGDNAVYATMGMGAVNLIATIFSSVTVRDCHFLLLIHQT
jgi:hypothetical protein